jgi:hypothetical protein
MSGLSEGPLRGSGEEILPAKFEVKKSDGTPIANFGNMLIENVVVTIN